MAGEIFFREMTPEDAAAVEIVERASFSMPWSRESFWREAANERTLYLLAVTRGEENPTSPVLAGAVPGGRVVGYVGLWQIDDEGQITNVAVHPDWRGRGISRRLLTELMARAARRGVVRMTLEVRPSNIPALGLYSLLGFRDCGRRPKYYADNGEDAIIMWNMDIKNSGESK